MPDQDVEDIQDAQDVQIEDVRTSEGDREVAPLAYFFSSPFLCSGGGRAGA